MLRANQYLLSPGNGLSHLRTTREERIRIIQEGLNQCGGACDFCNGCDNLGGGSVDTFYEPYINGEKELRQLECGIQKQHGTGEIGDGLCFSYRVLSGISTIMCGQAAVIRCMNWIRRWERPLPGESRY